MDRNDKVKDITVSESGSMARYHYADKGAKTFTVMKGSAEVVLNGKRFTLAEGDIFNAEAWQPYSVSFLSDDTVVREIRAGRRGQEHYLPDPAAVEDVDKASVQEAQAKGKGIYEFGAKGIRLLLKVGRWQLDGYKEIWECCIDKGYRLSLNGCSDRGSLFMVRSGSFRVEVDGEEFVACEGEDGLVRIPAGAAHAITALSEGCVIQAFNVSCDLFRLLEMVEAARDYFPEKLDEQAYIDYLFEANGVAMFESFEMVE
ncbi:MAG: cupin domain-containing protein [Clostridiales bacterium]|nr:cupin domain-containing protein [Clostridiales bacterium]